MNTAPLHVDSMTQSVWAVPPLARTPDGVIDAASNAALVKHIEAGGLSTLLYGGNAIFYHLTTAEFAVALDTISTVAADATTVIPAIGPAYGTMLDQAAVLRDYSFPTVMILPQRDIISSSGFASAVAKLSNAAGCPVVLYLKYDRMLDAKDVRRLVDDGAISAIKYAVVLDDPADDPELQELVDTVDPRLILSGLGDQPAWVHMTKFRLGGFTTGCGCVAPRLSKALIEACRRGDETTANKICQTFLPLENLRNAWSPITVLHAAVELAGIAPTGPVIPLLASINDQQREEVRTAAIDLLAEDASWNE